ncbi:MAG TPA: hypothetical protein VMF06_17285 [Candidatus Limnocylindria bacterium]|jgi:hypothetical protein|nr:hypothetical protein [Candidatus Limnocylindria bacterium]
MLGTADHWFPGEHVGKLNRKKLTAAVARSPFAIRLVEVLDLYHDAPVKRLSQRQLSVNRPLKRGSWLSPRQTQHAPELKIASSDWPLAGGRERRFDACDAN